MGWPGCLHTWAPGPRVPGVQRNATCLVSALIWEGPSQHLGWLESRRRGEASPSTEYKARGERNAVRMAVHACAAHTRAVPRTGDPRRSENVRPVSARCSDRHAAPLTAAAHSAAGSVAGTCPWGAALVCALTGHMGCTHRYTAGRHAQHTPSPGLTSHTLGCLNVNGEHAELLSLNRTHDMKTQSLPGGPWLPEQRPDLLQWQLTAIPPGPADLP